jgi:four helix bundle suffix protein
VEKKSRTHDQMVQAARSGVQNIAEGSQASGTSRKRELKLTNVARASLEELKLDYEDYLRHRILPLWSRNDPRRQHFIDNRCTTADEVAEWVKEEFHRSSSTMSTRSTTSTLPEIAANTVLALISVTCALLDRQIHSLVQSFEEGGGFSERLYRVRSSRRGQ